MKIIDDFLNNITMYRLVLWYLVLLLAIAGFFSIWGILPFSLMSLGLSVLILVLMSLATNILFSYVFKAQTNIESVYITALILSLIINPIRTGNEVAFLGWAAILSMASKYILAINKKHIFNPAALAVFLTALFINQSASWWVGTADMLPFVFLGGLLIARKIRRGDLVISFMVTAILTAFAFTFAKGGSLLTQLQTIIFNTSFFFFAFIMLTEPLTTPPTRNLRVLYGALVGFLFAPQVHFGSFYTTPEIALVAGNVFSYLVSPKIKLLLKLKEKVKVANGTYDFVFEVDKPIKFNPGQYLEWTLGHDKADARGNRRYFTVASSPTERDLRIGVKFYESASSFKKTMLSMNSNNEVVAGQLAGDFTLPKDTTEKLVFVAGGIGITPFRSMIKYLIDKNEKRDIVLFYANKNEDDIAYKELFDEAGEKLNLKSIYSLSDRTNIPNNWRGKVGRIDEEAIGSEAPDFIERTFYLSGPHLMVDAFKNTLKNMGVPGRQIKTDFFPGFA